MKKRLISFLLAGALALTGLQTNLPVQKASAAAGTRVSVHDPSVVKDGNTYYVFGSHIEAARSTNLRDWQRFSNGYARTNNVEFGNLSQNLAKAFAWAGEDLEDCAGGFAVWAPDVFWDADFVNSDGSKGAYLMYFCTSSTYKRSVIAFAASKKITGPYTFVDTLIYSGFTSNDSWATSNTKRVNRKYTSTNIPALEQSGQVSHNNAWFSGNGDFNNQQYPNAIDPTIYTDTDGRMYMCYGSWSGGIFTLEIDRKTGKCIHPKTGKTADGRMVDSYFGTKISGGWGKSGEGPFIEYNKDTGYYYLWVTYGGLTSTGGYNMRVGRSKSPLGPFVDAAGRNMVLDAGTNLDSIGLKVMGNYKFSTINRAYMACGHNSVLRDDDGEWYLLYHARFDDGGEGHEVRVHSMKFNEAGWPVVIPFEYCINPWSESGYETGDIAGTYEYINHGNATDGKIINYQNITLNADGTISGAVSGTWQQAADSSAATLKINNTTYQGYFAAEYDESTGKRVMVFTAVGNNNQTIWGAQTRAWSGNERSVQPITYADGKYIKSLTVNDKTNARIWSVVTAGKQAGSSIFGDREFKFVSVPKTLNSAEWIQTACDSKKFAGDEAAFTAGADISAFVALDTRITDVPAWLSGWTKTADTLTDDGEPQVTYQLWKKDFSAGQTVTLGEVNQSSSVNYTVAVTEQKQPEPLEGDINADGICDKTDLVMMRDYLLTTGTLTPDQGKIADMNRDGKVNAIDFTTLKRLLMSEPEQSGPPQPVQLSVSRYNNPFAGGITATNGKYNYGGYPAAFVDCDTVYAYTGHDISTNAEVDQAIYNIPEYLCYSTKDLVHWNYEGVVMNMRDVSWGDAKSAWASQVIRHNNKYYLYFCSWDRTAQGKQSIGVAVADSPKGPFRDIGHPVVAGTLTNDQASNWDDIDPTVWVEKGKDGQEHRYLAWGNSRYYICELNDDMTSVRDLNGDGKITFGGESTNGDVFYRGKGMNMYTEAPWLYRRQNADGTYYGDYYLIYAYRWREQMAYSTCTDLLKGDWKFGDVIFECNATSNTNHSGIFDFKGKTYMIYHNGALPEGNGYRRSPNICEVHFDSSGKIMKMEETTAGIGGIVSTISNQNGAMLGHAAFTNSINDNAYPYVNVALGFGMQNLTAHDTEWVIVPGLCDVENQTYVSIESENKTGLYVTVNANGSGAVLAQQTSIQQNDLKRATFRTVTGLSDRKQVSFESVSNPGRYLTAGANGALTLTDGSDAAACTFRIIEKS